MHVFKDLSKKCLSVPTSDREIVFEVFAKVRRKKIDFAHRSDALAGLGSRQLRAVKIPASYDAWRPPKFRKKKHSERIRFWGVSEISVSSPFLDFVTAKRF